MLKQVHLAGNLQIWTVGIWNKWSLLGIAVGMNTAHFKMKLAVQLVKCNNCGIADNSTYLTNLLSSATFSVALSEMGKTQSLACIFVKASLAGLKLAYVPKSTTISNSRSL